MPADQFADGDGGVRCGRVGQRGRGQVAPQRCQLGIGDWAVQMRAPWLWRLAQGARRAEGDRHLVAALRQQIGGDGEAHFARGIAGHDADQLQLQLRFGRQRQGQCQTVVDVGAGNAVTGIAIND